MRADPSQIQAVQVSVLIIKGHPGLEVRQFVKARPELVRRTSRFLRGETTNDYTSRPSLSVDHAPSKFRAESCLSSNFVESLRKVPGRKIRSSRQGQGLCNWAWVSSGH
ncbi:hypothetical protein NPIL_23861 [Nephila pilipes]|uniref:Uncharacterized protein n=1 Tax=Nephila pilipes TaxID=299642 RepID=A0A8X6UES2_NEPPI|nr:hypothetical protein NPIL_23861 [Nephila pilipes]